MSGRHPVDAAGLVLPDASWPSGKEAPGALELLRRFCNSTNPENGAERFRDPDQLDAWLEVEGLDPSGSTAAGLRRVIRFRGHVRALAIANRDGRHDRDALESLVADVGNGSLDSSTDAGVASRSPGRGRGASPLLAHLASIIVIAQADGSWSRLKACTNDHCRWMFYDHSKNANGAWCSMTACGQRHKAREYRAPPVRCRRAVAGLTVAHPLASLGIAAAATRDRSGTAFDPAQPRPLGDRVEAGKDERVECGRRPDVLRPHAGLDPEEVASGVGRPAGAGLERADVVETHGAGPTRARRRPVVVERHVEVVRVGGADDDVVSGLGEDAGVGGRLPHHDVAVGRSEAAVLGRLLPGPDLPAGDASHRLRPRRP